MKKIYSTLFMMMFAFIKLTSQVIYSENFSSTVPTALPSGWVQSASEWQTDPSDCCGGGIPVCTVFGTSGGNLLAFGDGSNNPNEAVTTNAFSTLGVNSMTLSWNGIRLDASSPAVTLLISDDNFASSTVIPFTTVPTNDTWASVSVAIPVAFENKASVRLRWSYNGANSSSYAGFDDIQVAGIVSPIYYYNGTGPLDVLTSWGTNTNGTGANPANFTANGQTFFLINTTSANLNNMVGSSWTVGGTSSRLVIGTGTVAINVTIPATHTLFTTGTATLGVSNLATLILQNTVYPLSNLSYSTGSTIDYAQASGTISIPATSHFNVICSGGGVRQPGGSMAINGNLAINSSNLLMNNSSLVTLTLTGTVSGGGQILTGNSGLNIGGSGALGTLTFGAGATILTVRNLTVNRTGAGSLTLGSNLTVSNTYIHSNGQISLNNNHLTLNGNITNPTSATNGALVGTTASSLTIGGAGSITNSLFFSQSSAATRSIRDITLNRNAANLTFGNAIEAWGSITPTVGTLNTGGNLTLKADATNKGRIGMLGGSGTLSGNVTVEVFKPSGATGWVNLCSGGVNGNNMAAWNSVFAITCSVCPDGWDVGGANFTSVYEYDETTISGNAADPSHYIELGVAPASKAIDSKTGYWVYLGDGFQSTNAITIPLTGAVNTKNSSGNINLTLTGGVSTENGWNLVANPFPSPIVANQITGSNFNTATMIGYDPDTDSNIPFTGAAIIPAGQAFMVQATSSSGANLSPDESWKSATANNTSILRSSSAGNYFYDDFLIDVTSNIVPRNFFTQAYFAFGNSFTNGYDIGECPSFPGQLSTTPRLYAKFGSMNLLRTGLPALTGTVSIPLILETGYTGVYSFNPVNLNKLPAGACVTLRDVINNVSHNLRSGAYTVNVNSNATTPQFELIITLNQKNLTSNYTDPTCTKLANGSITASGVGAGPWNYTWKDANHNIIKTTTNVNTSDVLSNVPVGSYFVDISKTGTCDNARGNFVLNSITPLPVAMISANTTTSYAGNNVPITFSNLSTNASGYEWSVNNGSNPVSTFQTTHLFNDAGFYVMTLKANNGACLDTATATQNIIIYENQPSVVGIDTKSKEQNNYFFSKDENGLFVMFNYNEFTDVEFQVSNILGQVLIPNQILSVSTSKHYYKVPEGQQLILVTIKENGKPRTNKVLNK
jgi:hypothetical protein